MTTMNKVFGLIVGVALATATSLAFAASSSTQFGGKDVAFESNLSERGINAPSNTNEFWYAGTSGWASE
jgi:hypothetical protein